jgi:hypothetical protein
MFMANKNKIKYVSGNTINNGAITNNNVALGVDRDIDYGPTTDTGFWQGVNPNNGGYTIYYLNGEEQPRIEVAKSDADLIFFANSFGAINAVTVEDALEFFKYGQQGYFITNRRFDSITTSGMTLMYDPGLVQSYPKGGNHIDNLGSLGAGINTPSMTLTSNGASVDFVDEKGGSLRFYNLNDGDGSYATADYSDSADDFTYNVWFKANSFDTPTWNAITSRGAWQQIGIFNGGYIDFYDENFNVDIYDESGAPQVILDKWYNVTVRHIEGVTTQLYLDNVLIGEDTTNTNLYNEDMTQFIIGSSNTNPDYFDGLIGHVAYYNRALSVAEIEKNYNALYQRYYGGVDGATALFMSSLPASDNFGYVIVDSATGVASGPFDTGVSHLDYYESDIKPLNHSGYALYFEGNDSYYDKKVLFIDSYGNVLDTFSGNTSNYSTNDLDGRVTIVGDYQNGIMKFFDGLNILTYTFDSNIEQAYVDWNYDATTRDKTFVIYTRNTDTNMVTWKLANVENGSIISLESYDNALYDTEPILYFNGDYVVMPFYDNNTNKHLSLIVTNTNGNTIYSENLSSHNYTDWDMNVFGTNKFSIIYTNYDDVNQDHQIFSFDGVNVTSTFVTRGNNFGNYNTYQQNYDWANQSYLSETMTYQFYANTTNSGSMSQTDYMKLVTVFNGSTEVLEINIATGSTIGFRWSPYGNVYNDMVTFGDNILKAMTVLPSGVTYTVLSNDLSAINGFDKYVIGNNNVFITSTDNTHPTIQVIDGTTGTITDTLSFTSSGGYSWGLDSSYDTFVVTDYDANIGWYICRNTPTFTQFTGQYQYRWSSNTFFTDYDTFAEGPYVVLFNPNTSNLARVVGPTGISNEFTLPQSANNNWSLYRGKNFMMYVYRDGNNGQPTARMIDYSGTTLGEFTDNSDQYWDFWTYELVGETILIVSGEGVTNGTQRVNAVKADGTYSTQTLSRYPIDNRWNSFNDYYWWNN